MDPQQRLFGPPLSQLAPFELPHYAPGHPILRFQPVGPGHADSLTGAYLDRETPQLGP